MTHTALHRALALAIATPFLLAACSGGGGVVRSSPPPASVPPAATPPPPPVSSLPSPCPAPVTGDCTVTGSATQQLPGGRQSTHALVIGTDVAPGALDFWTGDDSRFDGGTRIQNGTLSLSTGGARAGTSPSSEGTVLRSDVFVGERGSLGVLSGGARGGMLIGNVDNRGQFYLSGTVLGRVTNLGSTILVGRVGGSLDNAGRLEVGQAFLGPSLNRIDGHFSQTGSGVLRSLLPATGDWAGSHTSMLSIGGHASLDGTLELARAIWNDYGAWYGYLAAPLPTAPLSLQILHADGGVSGTFRDWRAAPWNDESDRPQPLFIEGNLRYGSNDVWFDLSRVSVAAAMATQSAEALTLESAGNLDRALAVADAMVAPDATQARFLQSAGRLLWMDDAAQAVRSLDSLAGSLHIDAMQALARDDALARGIGARTLAMQADSAAGRWARTQGADTLAGVDQWLSPRLLAGAVATHAADIHRDAFGAAADASPQAAAYVRWFGDDGWYAGGSAGYAQHALALDRRVDLGDGGVSNAHSQRRLGIASLDLEAGRRFASGRVRFAPYAWVGADGMRSERALEQGQTGFELALQANTRASVDAGVGLRVGTSWRCGDTGWLSMDADARYGQPLAKAGDSLRASFLGVPDAVFDLPGHDAAHGTWLDLGLRGGFGRGWAWSLGHAGSLSGGSRDRRWQLGLVRSL